MEIEKVKRLREIAKEQGNPVLRDKSYELLLETVKRYKPKTLLEIGTNVGLTSLSVMLTLKDVKVTGIEIDEDKKAEAEQNYKDFGVENRAKIFLGDASKIIPMLTGKYDFIFLDGPKGHYYEYVPYLISALNVGGVLFADNVLFRGYVEGTVKTPKRYSTAKNSMVKYLAYVNGSKNLKTTLYHIEDGVSITEKLYE